MILCCETLPLPRVWWQRANCWNAWRSTGASSKWLKRTPASCRHHENHVRIMWDSYVSPVLLSLPETRIRDFGIHFSTFYTTSLAFQEIWASCLVCQLNRFHLFLFVCPFHLSGNYSNYTNHLLSTCSRCHWSGPGNGWKDRFKSWSTFFHPEFPCKPDKSSSNPPPIQLLPLKCGKVL